MNKVNDADLSVWDAAMNRITGTGQQMCEDCPPVDYPTDETRCTPCPRRVADETIDKALRDLRDFVEHGKHPGEVITVTLADATSLVEYIGDGNDALAACQAQAAALIRTLTDALVKAVDCIRVWHNADVPATQRSELWDIYWRNAPELKPIRAALARATLSPPAKEPS